MHQLFQINLRISQPRGKPKTYIAGMNSIITWKVVQSGQDEIDGNAGVLYDSDNVSTKRQHTLKTSTASMNRKIDANVIVVYEGDITNSDVSSETLIMKKRYVTLKFMARKRKIKGYYKPNKAGLVEELVKYLSSF